MNILNQVTLIKKPLPIASQVSDRFTAVISYDKGAENPREWDNLGTLAMSDSFRYLCGNGDITAYDEFDLKLSALYEAEALSSEYYDRLKYDDDIEKVRDLFDSKLVSLPVYCYQHGNIALNTSGFSCRWDSGLIGYIFASKKAIRENFNTKRCSQKIIEKALAIMDSEIRTLSHWASGDCYSFDIYQHKKDQDFRDGDLFDSLCGFYGSDFDENGLNVEINSVSRVNQIIKSWEQ